MKVAIAETYERIHRSNLVGMGILPLQSGRRERRVARLTGRETFSIGGLENGDAREAVVEAAPDEGDPVRFTARVRLDTPRERSTCAPAASGPCRRLLAE